ncbi:polyphosphate kinase 2 family protein [Nocardioides rotundus]|uniref:PPK2 family polyphosphate kinase n=1 Tax=Nocardioides rotundus TaxID=1774216 RepID=UPI002958B529|nr:PPK2 family polyphosphate kinase [Nocardioides rotundus]UAL31223.1 polyphosphate kinase 2 family protein [Nocardioides rotundus]
MGKKDKDKKKQKKSKADKPAQQEKLDKKAAKKAKDKAKEKKAAKEAKKAAKLARQDAAEHATELSQRAAAEAVVPVLEIEEGRGGPTGESLRTLLKLPARRKVDLSQHDPSATPGFDGDKVAGKAALAAAGDPLAELQERLFADGRTSSKARSVLLVLQGMDTSGKGGVLRHSVGLMDPQGVKITSFKTPTAEERRRDFLWRIRRALPEPGIVGVFDRSHYEDVLIARVRELTTKSAITRRYDAINRFEAELAKSGVAIVKCFLHISPEEQKERLLARLDDPTKYWKFNPGDIDERSMWADYQEAYEVALQRCSTAAAPWYLIPSDRKWYRNWAIATLLRETLEQMDPQWPAADFDVDEQRRRLLEEDPIA